MDDPLSDNVHIIHGFKNHLVEKKLLWENITYVNEMKRLYYERY